VRAASGLARVGGRLAVIRTTPIIALLSLLDAAVALMLPAEPWTTAVRRSSAAAPTSACATAPGSEDALLAFGSGSAQRERVVLVEGWESPPLKVEVRDAPTFTRRSGARPSPAAT
jgi:hypothetical protein